MIHITWGACLVLGGCGSLLGADFDHTEEDRPKPGSSSGSDSTSPEPGLLDPGSASSGGPGSGSGGSDQKGGSTSTSSGEGPTGGSTSTSSGGGPTGGRSSSGSSSCGDGAITAGEACDGGPRCSAMCELACLAGEIGYGGHCYRRHTEETLFPEASQTCHAEGGYLVTLDTATEELGLLAAGVLADGVMFGYHFGGGGEHSCTVAFVWDGPPSDYLHWAPRYPSRAWCPDSSCDAFNLDHKDCLGYASVAVACTTGTCAPSAWRDEFAITPLPFACEYPVAP